MQIHHFNINNAKHAIKANEALHINLQVQKNGILLCAISVSNHVVLWTTYYEHNDGGADGRSMMAIMKDCEVMNIKSCIVGLDEDRMMILPNAYKDMVATKSAFEYVYPIENNDILEQQFLPWQDFFGAYVMKNGTKHVFTNWQKNVLFANTAISLLNIYTSYLQQDAHQLFISLSENKFVMTVYKNTELQLHAVNEMKSLDDVLYQIQKMVDMFSLENVAIQINGMDALAKTTAIAVYYSNTILQALPNGFIYPAVISKETQGLIFPILSIAKYANH